jgi:hypothetical protein
MQVPYQEIISILQSSLDNAIESLDYHINEGHTENDLYDKFMLEIEQAQSEMP